ncbi:hypothetical protein CROQUDRAFT_94465 [Cronartium quercuum f. sp. fusiforme G11]|uniref:Uncharacterized protein n=1 Tax=Cronartium quercuum f. sp. fusiforme G11 TaxID=708437 RepID=A0A9P6NFB0_9BASI|nr:hypothetical protein CROQUDRAFT_94465 [Cronartium quercuum f. sp. fusiforme G11]
MFLPISNIKHSDPVSTLLQPTTNIAFTGSTIPEDTITINCIKMSNSEAKISFTKKQNKQKKPSLCNISLISEGSWLKCDPTQFTTSNIVSSLSTPLFNTNLSNTTPTDSKPQDCWYLNI